MDWNLNKSLIKVCCLIVFLSCILLLIQGQELLLKPVFGISDFPLGTLIAWLGLISFSVLFFSFKALRILSALASVNSLLWGVMSFILAGNWRFEFSDSVSGFAGSTQAFNWFIMYSGFTLVFPAIIFLSSLIIQRFR